MEDCDQSQSDAVVRAEAGWRTQSMASATNYERVVGPAISRPWAERLLDRLALRPGARVLDLACGTGVLARLASGRVGPDGTVAGLDISPAMLTVARAQAAPVGTGPTGWHLGTAASLPFRDASFDGVACAFGLMFVSDRTRALAEIRRVLKPGGRLALSVWAAEADNPVDAGFVAVLRRYGRAGMGARRPAEYSLADPDHMRHLLTRAGFHAVTVDTLTDEHRLPLDAMLNRMASLGVDEATRSAARHDWLAFLGPYIDGDQVHYPVTAHLATAIASRG